MKQRATQLQFLTQSLSPHADTQHSTKLAAAPLQNAVTPTRTSDR